MWVLKVLYGLRKLSNFDGAAVMILEKARQKNRIPHLVVMDCIAHRLELAVLDLVKNATYLNVFEDTLKPIFKFYYYSTEYNEICHLLQQKFVLFSARESTQCLPSRLRCLTAVKKILTATIAHLEIFANSKGEKFKCCPKHMVK